MTLKVNDIEVNCIIGDREDERMRLQRLLVSVVYELPATAAGSDDLRDTVDYVAAANRIRTALVEGKCRMIERAAKLAFEAAGPGAVSATVVKSGAVLGVASAAVSYP